jgi:hypothetical protein
MRPRGYVVVAAAVSVLVVGSWAWTTQQPSTDRSGRAVAPPTSQPQSSTSGSPSDLEQRLSQLESAVRASSVPPTATQEQPAQEQDAEEGSSPSVDFQGSAPSAPTLDRFEAWFAAEAQAQGIDEQRAQRVSAQFLENQAQVDGSALDQVDCTPQMCRAHFTHESDQARSALVQRMHALFAWAKAGHSEQLADGSTVVFATEDSRAVQAVLAGGSYGE